MRIYSSSASHAHRGRARSVAISLKYVPRTTILVWVTLATMAVLSACLLTCMRARADEIFLPRHYTGAFIFSDMQSQDARLELEQPTFDPLSNKLLAAGTEWYKASNTWYSIPIKIEIDTDTFRFVLRRQLDDCDSAYDSPSMDPLIGVISYDFRKIVNDLSGDGEHALEDFVFKAVPVSAPFSGPTVASRCKIGR